MKKKCTGILLIFALLLTSIVTPAAAAQSTTANADSAYLQAVMQFAKDQYNFDVSDQELTEGALKGIFSSMDYYTEFYNMEEAGIFLQEVEGKFAGIGIQLVQIDDSIVISKVFPGSPAETAGLLPGDKIVLVDQDEVSGLDIDEVAEMISGDKGTQITLGVMRNGTSNIITRTITRDIITVNPINYEIKNGLGYISIDSFNANTYEYLDKALAYMDAHNINKIILDLRDNTGGEVDQAIEVAKRFVPSGVIATLTYKAKTNENIVYRSTLEQPKYKLAVLVNGMTASASEILSGAIQDTHIGTLIGSQTFGKARVQSIIPILSPEAYQKYSSRYHTSMINAMDVYDLSNADLSDDDLIGVVKITTGIYTTPAGRMIDQVGLTPDIKIDDPVAVHDVYVNSIVKLTKTSKPGLNGTGMDVYNAEKILRISGYDVDAPDLKLDQKTFAAISSFQKDNGLTAYGVLDFGTQDALNRQLEKELTEIDKQYAKAVQVLNETKN